MMSPVWLIVADSSKARFFSMESRTGPVEEIKCMVHTKARLHERDMTSDLPGRDSGKNGEGTHTYQNKISPKEQENINFASEIAAELDRVRKENKIKQFVLVASPEFLGKLREQMNEQTRNMVSLELAKNLSHLDPADIREHLPRHLPAL
ncbi:MAG: host attachment protein [Gammaproteobacteria bacterium]|nr:host attachment protein [Gammaproteobacteria bacterium]